MENFSLFASPWWVNLLILVPFPMYFHWKGKLEIPLKTLLAVAIFGIAFGFVEAAVVVYLRSATGFLSFKNGVLLNMVNFQSFYQKPQFLDKLPAFLFSIELYREIATVVMLSSVAFLASAKNKERWAMFFWAFSFWDIFYYAGLWLTIRWPASLAEPDILFFLPVPWFSQVWYPLLISFLFILSIVWSNKKFIIK